MKTGVLVVGAKGATASTMIATASCARQGDTEEYLLSEQAKQAGLAIPALDEIVWGGFDVIDESWAQTLERHGVLPVEDRYLDALSKITLLDPVLFELDHGWVVEGRRPATQSGAKMLEDLRDQIRTFRQDNEVEQLILVLLGGPAILPGREHWPETSSALIAALGRIALATAPMYYAAAAIMEGAAVVDYTASPTLEVPGLLALAEEHGVPLAGRDGSTGQTLLKSVLAETFATRRLKVRGWYSTNILGNHDGYVLSDDRFADTKRIDKTALLEEILGYDVDSHIVNIEHYGPAGDNKEAWDAIDFETWHGGQGQLRINWRASDSLLATPPILDLIRFTAEAASRGRVGIQTHLSMFFKYALGTGERRYLHLAKELQKYISG